MKKTQTKTKFSAFTLIELLVVIAILGILMGLMFPHIKGAIEAANAMQVGNNGKNFVQGIISANLERETMNLGSVWPTKTSNFSGSVDYTTSSDSETYFSDLITSQALENMGWSIFAGGGVPAAKGQTEFESGGYNVWNMIAGLDESAQDDTPFIFTRNFDITINDIKGENPGALNQKFLSEVKPFGNSQLVFVQRGGGVTKIKAKYLSDPRSFVGGSTFNDKTNSSAAVITAKGVK